MKKYKNKKEVYNHRLIPENEEQCIWMTAGMVAYKLCNRDFDCANCPFDNVMRPEISSQSHDNSLESGNITSTRKEVNSLSIDEIMEQFPPFLQKIRKNIYYHTQYSWVEQLHSNLLRIGLDPFLLLLIGNVHSIVLPSVGDTLHQGEYFCWLFGDYPTIHIASPVSGIVTSMNKEIRTEPERLIIECEDYIWLLHVKSERFQGDSKILKVNEPAVQWRNLQIHRLKQMFNTTIEKFPGKMGETLPDGGVALTHLRDILGKKTYFDIVSSYLNKLNK